MNMARESSIRSITPCKLHSPHIAREPSGTPWGLLGDSTKNLSGVYIKYMKSSRNILSMHQLSFRTRLILH